jgi:uncharacterized spore protein YtfJ
MGIEELVKAVLTELKAISSTETVVGEPIEVGEISIIPVSKITLGFAVGGGQKRVKEGAGEGTGGGATVEPVAFFVVRGDNVELITVKKESTGLGDVIDLVPKIIEKVKKGRGKEKGGSEGKGEKDA